MAKAGQSFGQSLLQGFVTALFRGPEHRQHIDHLTASVTDVCNSVHIRPDDDRSRSKVSRARVLAAQSCLIKEPRDEQMNHTCRREGGGAKRAAASDISSGTVSHDNPMEPLDHAPFGSAL
ncbi:hypothetical protein JOB18_000136 [Solea senegalensis]|uniref:Uncharacterized protein n=1 Tax=Solea senegalensis TaxID=28829 RepID=A0AAV6PRL4_SOLSE|nr:hypothetical protein JOB18_000136 [Solea senegalensis]